MPRLFNSENCLFQTFGVAVIASNATRTATFTGVTTDDCVCVWQGTSLNSATGLNGIHASVSAADTLVFHPTGASGAGSAVAQTVGVMVMKAPTSGQDGGSW